MDYDRMIAGLEESALVRKIIWRAIQQITWHLPSILNRFRPRQISLVLKAKRHQIQHKISAVRHNSLINQGHPCCCDGKRERQQRWLGRDGCSLGRQRRGQRRWWSRPRSKVGATTVASKASSEEGNDKGGCD
ncbi:hypothetical protein MUK42_21244 [Musa troglodytarum]|uniref:Uncharacterized protein n=1 Tax=Musa troglodytarum TaxID=320322 RepID=A0A9E7EY89_9LILI|nr:hypothetical protein MUK42_21244 [Musa troglodytarum]